MTAVKEQSVSSIDRRKVSDDPLNLGRQRNLLRLFEKKPRWGLTWPGRLLLVIFIALIAIFIIENTYPFLAVTHRVNTDTLVVEGWIHHFAIKGAAQEFVAGRYSQIYTTGGPTTGSGGYTWDPDTNASVGAGELRRAGVENVQMVPSHLIGRDRTYYSAIALRDWFRGHQMDVRRLNVVTESVHARRTWLLFKQAFGKQTEIGIIAIRNPDYDEKHWWRSSDGFRDVITEAVAYLYARFAFSPSEQS